MVSNGTRLGFRPVKLWHYTMAITASYRIKQQLNVLLGDSSMGILVLGVLLIALGVAVCLGAVLPHLLVGVLAIVCGILLVAGK
jgi:hypothetical protein